jgi:hypothetical protein
VKVNVCGRLHGAGIGGGQTSFFGGGQHLGFLTWLWDEIE